MKFHLVCIFILLFSYHVLAQCTGCTITNPSTSLTVGAGTVLCITTDSNIPIVQMSGGNINICNGATLTIGIAQISGGTLNIYGSSVFETGIDQTSPGTLTVNTDDCSTNNYKPGGNPTAPPMCSTLPITLVSFIAFQDHTNLIQIEWVTAVEKNNSHFYVQRSSDLTNWINIDTLQGLGDSHNLVYYSTSDASPNEGNNYYRLTQYDYNGENSSSGIVPVYYEPSLRLHNIYPNPATTDLHVDLSNSKGLESVKIYNTYGDIIYESYDFEEDGLSIDIQNINQGMYMIHFQYKDELIIDKFLKK